LGSERRNRKKLIGGKIYLHQGQEKLSHFGGTIYSFDILTKAAGEESNRIVFNFKAGAEFKGIKTGKEGWGNEKMIVL
jgi:hypothetical protein